MRITSARIARARHEPLRAARPGRRTVVEPLEPRQLLCFPYALAGLYDPADPTASDIRVHIKTSGFEQPPSRLL
ncbi:MAG TPA: hypothetical protein VNL70_10425, partial [Tepidisphaeraceae bacterium]|nr:hypothetical protein [Tepidisphaeraceae bacterium]